MLKIITFFSFAIIFVNAQDAEPIQECGSQTTNNNYYYSRDVNPVAGPSIQPPNDVLQGRPGKVGPKGFKGDKGDQGEPGVPDNLVVELMRSELVNLTVRFARIEDQNSKLTMNLAGVKDENSELTIRLADVEDENRELTMRLADVEDENRELTTKLKRLTAIKTNCNSNDVTTSGVYYIRTNLDLNIVYCEVETDGRNWLVFQKRIDGSVDFYRNWTEYQHGFGYAEGNYWLGLDLLHAITSSGSYQLRVDLEDWENNTAYALYSSFSVGDESSNYRLRVFGYSGNAGDSLDYHNNRPFSTRDNDNDININLNCAVDRHGAWWYGDCENSNLNGEYLRRQDINLRANHWWHWKNGRYSLKRSVMKIRPN